MLTFLVIYTQKTDKRVIGYGLLKSFLIIESFSNPH